MGKRFRSAVFLLVILLAAICIMPQAQEAQAATLRLNKVKVTLAKGAKVNLKVAGTNKRPKWSTDKKKVATVTSKGVVTAKGKGVARITARIGKKKLVCRVTVETPKLSRYSLTVNVGKAASLKVTGTKGKVRWYTQNRDIAIVNQRGTVRGVRVGNCYIYAKVNGRTYICEVNVTNQQSWPNTPITPSQPDNDNFDPISAARSIKYESHRTDHGVIIIAKNNYRFSVRLNANVVYYNSSNTMVGTTSDYCYVLEPGRETVLHTSNPYDSDYRSVEYSRYVVNLSCEKATAIGNAGYIFCDANFGSGNVMVTARNNGGEADYTAISVVYYKDGNVVGYEYHFADINNPGSTDYIQFSFPYDSDYNTIVPDDFKVFVNYSYRYSW